MGLRREELVDIFSKEKFKFLYLNETKLKGKGMERCDGMG